MSDKLKTKARLLKAYDILSETWDLLNCLEAREDESHQKAIRENKAKLEALMYVIDTHYSDLLIKVKR